MTHEIVRTVEAQMKRALDATQHDFAKIRTGRASPSALDTIMVDYYGVPTPIPQVGSVSVPEPRQLMISPYDKSLIPAIEKAIINSDLDVNPNNDGNVIRLIFPEMTEDRRKQLVKQVHTRTEDGCVSVRHARRDGLDALKTLEDETDLSEDERKRLEKEIQALTDKYIEQTHELQKKKDEELMTI